MAVTLLITATGLEAAPLRSARPWQPLAFSLGELYTLPERNLFLAHLGIAKVNTAAGLSLALHSLRPDSVIQFGIGGAFRESGLTVGQLAVATAETHMDIGVEGEDAWQDMRAMGFSLLNGYYNTLPTDTTLTDELARITGARPCPFGTSETVTGSRARANVLYRRFGAAVESMEGAAAAQVCTALGVPFVELRAVSNEVGVRDKAQWDIRGAVARLNDAVLSFTATLEAT